eukprot:m.200583 g.200583  ORF g.200583 m.200583 type:complete len:94 (+) comp53817_c0_seq12:1914-2195(+)
MRDSFTLVHTLAPITATSALVGLAGGLVAFKFRKPILRNSAMFSAYGAAVSSVFFGAVPLNLPALRPLHYFQRVFCSVTRALHPKQRLERSNE